MHQLGSFPGHILQSDKCLFCSTQGREDLGSIMWHPGLAGCCIRQNFPGVLRRSTRWPPQMHVLKACLVTNATRQHRPFRRQSLLFLNGWRQFRVTPAVTRLDVGKPTEQRPVSLKEMGHLLLQEKKTFTVALAGIGVASACQLCIPYIFGSVVDLLSATVGENTDALHSNTAVLSGLQENAMAMLGVGLAGTAATYASTSQLDIVGQRISMNLRKRLFGNIVRGWGGAPCEGLSKSHVLSPRSYR